MTFPSDSDVLFQANVVLPEALFPWLTHQSSITDLLFEASGDAKLEILKQFWCVLDPLEQQALSIQGGQVLHREIIMKSQNVMCWYARTLIPEETYQLDVPFFNRLEKESLGALIYDEPSVKRVERFFYPIGKKWIAYFGLTPEMHENATVLWLRKSIFTFMNRGEFYLFEIFLPGLLRVVS